jgi:hypothetical protein
MIILFVIILNKTCNLTHNESYNYFVIGSARMNKLMNDQFIAKSEHLHALLGQARRVTLGQARRVTLCFEGSTNKGLFSSYVGISAALPTSVDPSTAQPQ